MALDSGRLNENNALTGGDGIYGVTSLLYSAAPELAARQGTILSIHHRNFRLPDLFVYYSISCQYLSLRYRLSTASLAVAGPYLSSPCHELIT